MKPSEIFEGENSSLKKTYENATIKELEVTTYELVKYSGQTFSKASEAYEYIALMLSRVYQAGVKDTVRGVEEEIEKLPMKFLTKPDEKGEYRTFSFSGINKSNVLHILLNKLKKSNK